MATLMAMFVLPAIGLAITVALFLLIWGYLYWLLGAVLYKPLPRSSVHGFGCGCLSVGDRVTLFRSMKKGSFVVVRVDDNSFDIEKYSVRHRVSERFPQLKFNF